MLAHNVYFRLNDDSPQAIENLVGSCKKYLRDHPGVVFFAAGTLEPEPYPAQAAPTPRELGTWRVPRSAAEFLARVEAYLLPREPGLFGQFMDALAGFRRAIDGRPQST